MNNSIYEVKTIRVLKVKEPEGEPITTESEAFSVLKKIYKNLDADQEHFVLLALDGANKVTGYKVIASGGQTSTMVDLKILFRNALLLGATAIIVAHNHPTGRLIPTDLDKALTERIKDCCDLLDIAFLDHLIISPHGYCRVE